VNDRHSKSQQPTLLSEPRFFEERPRVPLTNRARDEFLKALNDDARPTEALLTAAEAYRRGLADGRIREG